MKQKLLGTQIGRWTLAFRSKFSIIHTACFYPERVGCEVNDRLANRLVTKLCQSNKTFIDIGAHIGSIISEVMYADSSIKIIAIEAIPEKTEKLQRKFPSITLYNCAVGNMTGEVAFFVNTRYSGYSSLRKKSSSQKEGEILEITVSIKKLDDLISSDDVDVIKIDVEGTELEVIQGGINVLKKNRPIIMFESTLQSDDGANLEKEEIYQFFTSNDYLIIIPNRLSHNDFGLSKEGFLESHLYPRRTTNYFAIPNERQIDIRESSRNILGMNRTQIR